MKKRRRKIRRTRDQVEQAMEQPLALILHRLIRRVKLAKMADFVFNSLADPQTLTEAIEDLDKGAEVLSLIQEMNDYDAKFFDQLGVGIKEKDPKAILDCVKRLMEDAGWDC